jgi:hypothetical protein
VLLVKTALTLRDVLGPVIVSPLVAVRFFRKLVPLYKLLTVKLTVTLVIPAGELAVKVNVEDG